MLTLSRQSDITENHHERLWPEVIHAWGNTKDPSRCGKLASFYNFFLVLYLRLFRFLNRMMGQKRSATYLWVAMTHLTPRSATLYK